MTGTPAQLRAVDITKDYGGTLALDRVSIDIRAGEFLTLLGPSGSGNHGRFSGISRGMEPAKARPAAFSRRVRVAAAAAVGVAVAVAAAAVAGVAMIRSGLRTETRFSVHCGDP